MKTFAGLASVAYADTVGGAFTTITGKIGSESTITPENTKTESTDGNVFGGGQVTAEVHFLDFADYDTMEGFMTTDAAKAFRFTFKDGTIVNTQETIIPFVRKMLQPNARDGAQTWVLELEKFSHQVLTD